ncbi:MAG: hypothetical protein ABR501_10235 [Pyrinomonadaceae bacterium]
MTAYYKTEKEIQGVVRNFELCITGKDDFGHLLHLTVAVWYLQNSSTEQAFDKMRTGLLRFLDHHAVEPTPYSDELTMSWIRRVDNIIKETGADVSIVQLTNIVLERLGHSRLILEEDEAGHVKEGIQEDQSKTVSE